MDGHGHALADLADSHPRSHVLDGGYRDWRMKNQRRGFAEPPPTGFTFSAKVIPNAREEGIGLGPDRLVTIKVHAKPLEGKATARVLDYLADYLRLPKNQVQLCQGERSRIKRIHILGYREEDFYNKIREEDRVV
jgi:hypothetical protein